jgi:serine protease Do
VAAALATLWQAPTVSAAGQQAGSQNQQTEKPKVEKQVITVQKQTGGEPMVVTVEKQAGQDPKVITHSIQTAPMIAALGGGPRLGVRIRDVGKDDLAKFKLGTQAGVVVEEVTKDSAAEKAGVKAGDVIVQFDGENVRSAAQLTRLVRESVAGRNVKMGVFRDGKRMDLDVTPAVSEETFNISISDDKMVDLENQLKEAQEFAQQYRYDLRPPEPGQPIPPRGMLRWKREVPPMPMPIPDDHVMRYFGDGATGNFYVTPDRGRLGVNVQELTPELATYFGVKDGLLVNSVQADTPAAKAGIKAGDVIGSVNGKAVFTTTELIKELADKDGEITIGVTRDKKPLSLKATLEPRKTPARRTPVVGRPA